MSIGVGSGIRSDWLDKISDYNFTASSFSALGAIIDTIVKAACTDVDVGVGCSANGVAVGGNGTVQLTLDNPSPYDVTGAIPMNITLPTAGLSLVGVTATAGAPPSEHLATGQAHRHRCNRLFAQNKAALLLAGQTWWCCRLCVARIQEAIETCTTAGGGSSIRPRRLLKITWLRSRM